MSNCNLDLRNAVVDSVSGSAAAFGVSHAQIDDTTTANVAISDVELRSESGGSGAYGIYLYSAGAAPAGTYGRVTDVNVRATGGSQSSNTYAIRHSAVGDVQYRGLSLVSGGSANFLYGIQTNGDGTPRFDDVVIDATGEAESTVFGVEFHTDSTTLTNARIKALNLDTGTVHDAVGIKANNADGVVFTDVTASAQAETNVWGADLSGNDTRLVRADLRGVSTAAGVARGAQCSGSTEIHDSLLRGESAAGSSYGFRSIDCSSAVTDSEMIAGGAAFWGFYASAIPAGPSNVIRDGLISGTTASLRTINTAQVVIVGSQLDGPAASSSGASDVQECTAVTYNSGGSEVFQAATSDPCP